MIKMLGVTVLGVFISVGVLASDTVCGDVSRLGSEVDNRQSVVAWVLVEGRTQGAVVKTSESSEIALLSSNAGNPNARFCFHDMDDPLGSIVSPAGFKSLSVTFDGFGESSGDSDSDD